MAATTAARISSVRWFVRAPFAMRSPLYDGHLARHEFQRARADRIPATADQTDVHREFAHAVHDRRVRRQLLTIAAAPVAPLELVDLEFLSVGVVGDKPGILVALRDALHAEVTTSHSFDHDRTAEIDVLER